jgi:hypothetical protein
MSARGERSANDWWRLDGPRATLAAPHLGAAVDLHYPAHGLKDPPL